MGGATALETPSVPLSFANNFWGKDDAGVAPLLDRMHAAKATNDELKSFYGARAAIEEEYARKLLSLARRSLGSNETGTLRMSMNVIRSEVETMGKTHQNVAQQMKTELEEPLAAFAGAMKERRKIVQNGIEKLLKLKMHQTSTVNKARDRYEQDCLKIKGFLAQAHMVMGHEERKNKAKLEKTQINLTTTSSEYESAIKFLEETTGRWDRDWKIACDKFQDLEEERINFTKNSLFDFANIASTVCVSDDEAWEKIRLSLEDCDEEKDIVSFVKEFGTGSERPGPPKFIDFCRGDAETLSQSSEDENYTIAQFARTMNPAYRASSPAPSAFESHHDPNNPLAREMGLQKNTQPIPQDEISVVPRSSRETARTAQARNNSHADARVMPSQRAVQPDPRLIQAQEQARHENQQSQIPHNDFPMDGMTQFCRMEVSSDRSALPSPARPNSRDSQSECSNATSFSSVEVPVSSASPTKPTFQPVSPAHHSVEESSVNKKRAFFNSPFTRRKSKHEIEPPSIPSNRNTWGSSSRKTDGDVSPTKPGGRGSRSTVLQDATRSTSPEPVDPRANFQLNIGNNVFDVASPDKKAQEHELKSPEEELDPIAQALEELKGVTKQASLRVSADRYHGLTTPQPSNTPSIGSNPLVDTPAPLMNVNLNAAKRGTPPPSYDQPPVSLLGAPKPAHTSRQMQKTTQMYVSQRIDMFNGDGNARPSSRNMTRQDPPRATSPVPPRAISPRPVLQARPNVSAQNSYRIAQSQPRSPSSMQPAQRQTLQQPQPQPQPQQQQQQRQKPVQPLPTQQASQATSYKTSTAPSAYAASKTGARPRSQTTSATAQVYGTPSSRSSHLSTRGVLSSGNAVPRASSPQPPQPSFSSSRPQSRAAPSSRAVSPQPQFRQSHDRPSSSRGSDMALQLAPGGKECGEGSGGSQRGRGSARPQTAYYSGGGGSDLGVNSGRPSSIRAESRVRSKSLAEPKNYNSQGRLILHYSRAMYTYAAQIPEELGFQKGDILAVLRLQDDGWWEAEAVGKNGPPGLVPSNYLQAC